MDTYMLTVLAIAAIALVVWIVAMVRIERKGGDDGKS
jgi:hypothetical protein